MKKTIFKGTINGKEFDNVQDYVQDYNRELTKLLTCNKPVNASAETKTVDDDEECETQCKCSTSKRNNFDYTPFLKLDENGNKVFKIFDDILSTDEPAETLENVSEYLNEKCDIITKAIKNWMEDDLAEYSGKLNEARNLLKRYDYCNNNATKSVKNKINDLEKEVDNTVKQINLLEAHVADVNAKLDELAEKDDDLTIAGDTSVVINSFYKAVEEAVNNRLNDVRKIKQAAKPVTQTVEKNPQKEFDLNKITDKAADELAQAFIDVFKRILK